MPTLLVIDVQRGFDDPSWGARNNPDAEERIAEALSGWRRQGGSIIHVRHESTSPTGVFRPGTTAAEFKSEAVPCEGEPVITKTVNSGFIGTDLEQRLRTNEVQSLAIVGLTTDHCCSTTARMASNLGFEVWVLADAMATFARTAPDGTIIDAEQMHRAALASLMGEFAEVLDVRDAVARLRTRRTRAPAGPKSSA